MIEIVFRSGEVAHYKPSEYTEYRYDGKYFIVIKDCQWIGFYNLDCVECIEIEPPQTERHLPDYSVEAQIGRELIDCPWK